MLPLPYDLETFKLIDASLGTGFENSADTCPGFRPLTVLYDTLFPVITKSITSSTPSTIWKFEAEYAVNRREVTMANKQKPSHRIASKLSADI